MAVKKKAKPLLYILVIICFLFITSIGSWIYLSSPVDKNDSEDVIVEIKSGESTSHIGVILKEKRLIHSTFLFKVYVKLYSVKSLKASTYIFHRDMNLKEIINTLENGSTYNPNMVKLTFKEGLRITDYAKLISEKTNHSYDEVIHVVNDKEYLKDLSSKYWFITEAIFDEDIYYPLEGYLAPDTYHFDNKDVDIKDIIETMLDEMEEKLSPYQNDLKSNIHYYMTMASIVELEGTNTDNRKMIVGIFENRLHSGMNLGSDVTTYYGLQVAMTSDLSSDQFLSVNAYNTRSTTMIGKMPVGPICSFDLSSLEASIHPTDNDYLFFVADKNGKIYYTKTMKEHERKIAEIKANGDWIW